MSSKALETSKIAADRFPVSAGHSNRVAVAPELAITRSTRDGDIWASERAFFRECLADAEPALLPNDRRQAPGACGGRTATIESRLERPLSDAARAIARGRGLSLLSVFAAPFVLFLKKYARVGDVLIGTCVRGLEPLCPDGNVLPLRVSIDHDASFADLLATVDAAYMAAKKHGRIPFGELVAELASIGRSGFIRMLCSVDDQELASSRRSEHGRTEFELELEFVVRDSGCALRIQYDQTLFDESTLRLLSDCVCHFLEQGSNRIDSPLREIRFPSSAPRAELIGPMLRSNAPSPAFYPVTARVAAIAAATPDALAVACGEARLSYGDLLAWADDVRREALRSVQPGDRVGVVCRDDDAYAASCLAVWLEGCTLVPIDPEYPLSRVQFVLSNAGVTTILDSPDAEPIDCVPGVVSRPLPARPRGPARAPAPAHPLRPETAAYILYTSGSTGSPRGAAISHGNLSAFFQAALALYDVGPSDRWAWLHTVGFDVSMWETWGPLCSGGSLWFVPKWTRRDPIELRQFVDDHQLTILCQAPSAFYEFIRVDTAQIAGHPRPSEATPLRYVVLAGEVLDPARLREWFQKHDDAHPKIVNNYGITETTIYDTFRVFSRQDADVGWVATPVGAPYPNVAMRIEDEYSDVVPVGGRGELVLAGDLVGLGYVQREELTRQKFGSDRWPGVAAETPTYKSGDLARVLRNGELVVEGRIDQQFQLRGFRVEPGEVEGVLLGDPLVRSVVVQSYRLGSEAADSLVAYLLPVQERDQVPTLDAAAQLTRSEWLERLRSRVAQALPEYMRPTAYVVLAEWPRTASGKLDRKALPAPRSEARDAATCVPGTELEESVLVIWQEMLAMDAIAWDDDFFSIGGHSLLAARICAALESKIGVRIALRDFFRLPTPRGLAQMAADLLAKSGPAVRVPTVADVCEPSHRLKPFPLTPVQQAYWIGRQNVIGLGDVSTHSYVELDATNLDVGRFTWALRQVIARHDMLRCVVESDMTQRILLDVPAYEIVSHDLESLHEAEREQRLSEIRSRLGYEVRSSDRWPLFAVEVSRLAKGRVRLHVSGDALAVDGSGWQQVMRDTLHYYRSDTPLPSLPPFSFRDYVLAVEKGKDDPEAQAARAYWMDRLPRLPPAPELPTARPLEQVDQRSWKRLTHRIPAPRWSLILDQIRAQGVTPSIALASAFARVLAHFSTRPHFCLNLTLFNRLPIHPDVGHVVGDFTTLLLLEAESRANESFVTMAKRVQAQFFEDFDHRAISGVDVLRAMSRGEGRAPGASMPIVFTSMLSLDGGSALDELCEALGGSLVYGISQTSQVWLDHQVMEQSGCLVWNWDFLESLFHPGFVEEMFETYLRVVDGLADESSWRSPICLETPAASGELESTRLGSGTLIDGFVHHARQTPERGALIYRGIRYTYGAVLAGAYALAGELLRAGVAREEPVIVNCEEPPAQVTAMLGILLAGAAYVPLPTELPRARVEEIGRLVRGRLALTDHAVVIDGLQVLSVPDPLLAESSYDALALPSLSPEQLAYVIFTSGTTGAPKGVSMTHGAAMNTIRVMNDHFGIGPDDCCLALSAIGFDLSVYDIFGLLGVGGSVAYPDASHRRDPETWYAVCQDAGVTLWNSVPALAQMFADYLRGVDRRLPASLRQVWWSGDWIPVDLPTTWRKLAGRDLQITSLGGATEGGIWSVFYPIREVDADWVSIPYGKSLPGQCIEVLDHELRPRPQRVVGEICIAGASLARGYYGLVEQTAQRFVRSASGLRWYRTGDLGRRLPDGNIEFLGRQDGQVKVRGHRIETAEVEARLLRRDMVAECAVLAKGPAHARTELVAYVVRSRGFGTALPTALKLAIPELPEPLANVPKGLEDRCRLIEDLEERARFKISRSSRPSHDGTILPVADIVRGEAPRRYSSRRFQLRALPKATFGAWLAVLAAFNRAGERARNYGSAGGLYPVQVYVCVNPGRVEGIPAGSYWFDPEACALCRVSQAWRLRDGSQAAINEQLVNESALAVYLVLDLTAIAPIYGENSVRYATLETGAITQLLETHGASRGIGMCQLGAVASDAVAETCRLGSEHVLLHAAVAGLAETNDAGVARPSQSQDMRVRALIERVSALSENEAQMLEQAILSARPAGASGAPDAKSH